VIKKNLETEYNDLQQSTVFYEKRYNAFPTWFSFFVNKKKKNYKVNFSTSSILKKIDKYNFRKKIIRGNTVAIHSVLWGKLQCFSCII
jgi:hypothetical protein